MAATHADGWRVGRVVESRPLTDSIRRIVIEVPDPKPVPPGAHVDVRIEIVGAVERRSYSVVDSSSGGDRIALSVFDSPTSRGGAAVMHALPVGAMVEVTQPLLDFPLRIGARRYVLLAGGIGVTALASMAAVLRRIGADYRIVYVGRSRAAMAYLDELARSHGDRLAVHIGDEGTSLRVGELIETAGYDTELYMCGPIRLMDDVRRSWSEAALPVANLRYETFGNSGWFDAEAFTVRLPHQGIETVVGPNQTMLEALVSAGAEMMFDCRKGECGLCEVRILELDGDIDHRDVFYSERQKNARGKMCCCVSRAVGWRGAAVVTIESS